MMSRIVAVVIARITRRNDRDRRPQKITLRRSCCGTRAAAMPMTTALSPASTMSIRMT